MRLKIISILNQYYFLHWGLWIFHRLIGKNRFKNKKKNIFCSNNSNIYKNYFEFGKGENNQIIIDKNNTITNSKMLFKGSNNKVYIGENGFVNGLELILEGDNNTVIIGEEVFILDDTRIYIIDGSTLKLGRHCMFSDRIEIRTSDHHSIIDIATGKRINYEEDIIIGDDVWLGSGVTILKGSEIANGCIVGAKSLITDKYKNENTIIVGSPGREIKSNVEWRMDRIK